MKKIISLALVVLLIATLIPMAVFADGETKATDIVDITGKAAGDKITLGGVEYTLIDSADDVVAANGNYYLMNDLTITTYFLADKDNGNTSTTNDESVFVGCFNGGGHTITLDGAKSVFGKWLGSETTVICNFTMKNKDNAVLTVGGWGSPLGFYACKGGTFYNITNEVKIKSTAANAGGVVGGFSQIAPGTNVTKCVNKADLELGSYYSGGVLGAVGNSANGTVTVEDCVNEGKITYPATDASHGYIGGVFGGVPKNCNGVTVNIKNCKNSGDIEANCCYAGGIAGANYSSTGTYYNIENCENTGAVTAKAFAAGIFAGNKTGGIALATIKNCVNKGAITGTTAVAGIVAGTAVTATGANFVLDGCTNSGKITATAENANAGAYVGFLNAPAEGEANVTVTATNCTNTGDINGGNLLSGDPNLVIPLPTPPAQDPVTPPTTSDITVFAIVIATVALAGVCVAKKKIKE